MRELARELEQGWRERAACVGQDVNMFITSADEDRSGRPPTEAIRVCMGCPVRVPCLQAGMYDDGVWGGTTEKQRLELRNGRRTLTETLAAGDRLGRMQTRVERGLEGDSPLLCPEDGCSNPVRSRGLCKNHHARLVRAERRAGLRGWAA